MAFPDPEPQECKCGEPRCADCFPFGTPIERYRDLYLTLKQTEYVITLDGKLWQDCFVALYEYATKLEILLDKAGT